MYTTSMVSHNCLKVKYPLDTFVSYVCSTQYTYSKMYQELYDSTSANKGATMKDTKSACVLVKGATSINCHLKSEASITLCCKLCSTSYTAVQIRNYSKSESVTKVATMKIRTISTCGNTTKSTLFIVSKVEWSTKEDTGKSMKNVLYNTAVCKKGLFGLKRR